ncbi:hypothetical protein [Paractinoplanes maris]|uniref:hypothetical protein n=1 Tax=Paractinoplanes maris TaxID=1734446 RepID=UPI00201FB665|nr:hypothetical protein [Actinoplanes maris]
MTAVSMAQDVKPEGKGWRVFCADGTERMVLPRPVPDKGRYAVFTGDSTEFLRDPPLGYAGSWGRLGHALDWAREAS